METIITGRKALIPFVHISVPFTRSVQSDVLRGHRSNVQLARAAAAVESPAISVPHHVHRIRARAGRHCAGECSGVYE